MPLVNRPGLNIQDVLNVPIQDAFVAGICGCHIPLFLRWPIRFTQLNNILIVIWLTLCIWPLAMNVVYSMSVVPCVMRRHISDVSGNLTTQISAVSAHCIMKPARSSASITFQEIESVSKPIRGDDYTQKLRGHETFALQTCSSSGINRKMDLHC